MATSSQIGPRDIIRADGSYNWKVLMALALRRAAGEVELNASLIARGRLGADCATTMRAEVCAAIRHYRGIAKVAYQLHPANRDRIQFYSVTAYGRQVTGVRHSAF